MVGSSGGGRGREAGRRGGHLAPSAAAVGARQEAAGGGSVVRPPLGLAVRHVAVPRAPRGGAHGPDASGVATGLDVGALVAGAATAIAQPAVAFGRLCRGKGRVLARPVGGSGNCCFVPVGVKP